MGMGLSICHSIITTAGFGCRQASTEGQFFLGDSVQSWQSGRSRRQALRGWHAATLTVAHHEVEFLPSWGFVFGPPQLATSSWPESHSLRAAHLCDAACAQ